MASLTSPGWAKRSLAAFAFRLVSQQRATTRLFSSSFQPLEPPGTHGTPVFPDIQFSVQNSPEAQSFQRNTDPNAVFVVTGASRGIGLQFCKTLLERTEVGS